MVILIMVFSMLVSSWRMTWGWPEGTQCLGTDHRNAHLESDPGGCAFFQGGRDGECVRVCARLCVFHLAPPLPGPRPSHEAPPRPPPVACAALPWWRPVGSSGRPAPAACSPASDRAAAPGESARCARSRGRRRTFAASPAPPGSGRARPARGCAGGRGARARRGWRGGTPGIGPPLCPPPVPQRRLVVVVGGCTGWERLRDPLLPPHLHGGAAVRQPHGHVLPASLGNGPLVILQSGGG